MCRPVVIQAHKDSSKSQDNSFFNYSETHWYFFFFSFFFLFLAFFFPTSVMKVQELKSSLNKTFF